jgi:hypothetical protein
MRHFFVEKVKAIVSNVDYEKATMHVENIDVPYFDTLDKWGDFVKELNVANRADRISGTDLALEMNGGKTAHINKLDIDLDYINDGGEHELPDGELEVSFHLVSKGSIYYLRELWFGNKPVYVTYQATAENIDIDIDIDETEEYDRYDDEFFESVYREANKTRM